MDAITLLKEQHREVEALLKAAEKAESPKEKKTLFQQIGDNLAAHAAIEEEIFYPAIYRDKTEDILREAVEEHLAAKRIIADLLDMDETEPQYGAKLSVLREQIEHHVKEEEKELFPEVKKGLHKAELEEMGSEMEALFTKLMKRKPRETVRMQTGEAAPLE